MESDVSNPSANKPGRKKSRFAKPAWASSGSTARSKEQEDALFSRSTHTYEEILAEEAELKASEQPDQKETKRSPSSRDILRDGTKRRRLSREDDDDVHTSTRTRKSRDVSE